MHLFWLYNLPNWAFCLLVVGAVLAFGVGGLVLARPLARRVFGPPPGCNDLVSYFLSAMGVFYGITLGLIAIGAWENFNGVSGSVSREAAAIATLCQDVRAMPDKGAAATLNADLKEYLRYTIEDAWPVQRQGQIPKGGTERLSVLHEHLLAIEATRPVDQSVQNEMLSRLNTLIEMRRLRLESVEVGLPGVLWLIVIAGGALSVATTWFFVTERPRAHLLLVAILCTLVGLLIFMVAAMDNPFRGELSVSPRAFEIVLDRYFGEK